LPIWRVGSYPLAYLSDINVQSVKNAGLNCFTGFNRALAGLICSSDASITAYLEFGREEAKALIGQHRAAVLAITEALMIHHTLDATMIDTIIAAAPERARRADWAKVMEGAAGFAGGLER
jgi:hypothetical protein